MVSMVISGDTYVEVDMGAQTVYYFKKGKLKFTTLLCYR